MAMLSTSSPTKAVVTMLLMRTCGRIYAIPTSHVSETLRPLPTDPVPGMPDFLLGLSMIRGVPTPVVDLGRFLGLDKSATCARFVRLRVDHRQIALAVESVLGVDELDQTTLQSLPPIFTDHETDAVSTMGTRDAAIFLVLKNLRFLTEEMWRELGTTKGSA